MCEILVGQNRRKPLRFSGCGRVNIDDVVFYFLFRGKFLSQGR
jgi:hypothetical protein